VSQVKLTYDSRKDFDLCFRTVGRNPEVTPFRISLLMPGKERHR